MTITNILYCLINNDNHRCPLSTHIILEKCREKFKNHNEKEAISSDLLRHKTEDVNWKEILLVHCARIAIYECYRYQSMYQSMEFASRDEQLLTDVRRQTSNYITGHLSFSDCFLSYHQ